MDSEYLIHVVKPCQLRFRQLFCEKNYSHAKKMVASHVSYTVSTYMCAVSGSCPRYTAMFESYIVL